MHESGDDIRVVKLGGSVLTDLSAYATAAAWLASEADRRPADRIVTVVSAEGGRTDALAREAAALAREPDPGAVDLLWSTGELQSVARLTIALRALRVCAIGLNAHETGIRHAMDSREPMVNALVLRAALARHRVVVVPGFLGIRHQRIVTLGRGGSDLSAVRLAVALRARECVLIKDVDGYFTADPAADPGARLLATLTYAQALAMARSGCPLVQQQAIEEGQRAHLPLIIRSMTASGTVVRADDPSSPGEQASDGVLNQNHSCRSGHRAGNGRGRRADLSDHHVPPAGAG